MSAPGQADSERKGQRKRKHADALAPLVKQEGPEEEQSLAAQVKQLVETLQQCTAQGPARVERPVLRAAAHGLAELSKLEENVDAIVESGAVQAVVPLLSFFTDGSGDDIEKEACFILGLLAVKQDYQHVIADFPGALPGLVGLLKRYLPGVAPSTARSAVARRAADAVTNLAHENTEIKSRVRTGGAIEPLVGLLSFLDGKVQRAAAGALRTLAFKNEENKNEIVERDALPKLIQMLRSDDSGLHYEAIGVIGNLVHSSTHIKRKVLEEGALQPVISLLSSRCSESQREAALLLGQFATAEPDFKARIVQRGAVPPLIVMLEAADPQLREMAAFALGRLAQNPDNQAGIVQAGGLGPLLELMASRSGNLQHNAAFTLYGLADSEDNVAEVVRCGAVQCLQDVELMVQPSRDCVQKTLKRLEDKVGGRVLEQITLLLNAAEPLVQQRAASALAHLAKNSDLNNIFNERKGLDVLLHAITDTAQAPAGRKHVARALYELAKKAIATAPVDCAPELPRPQVYLGEQYVNNETLSDVTFLVEGRTFHAHRIALLASSDTFRAMFDGHYREKEASTIAIPNIRFDVFRAMMCCIYTGSVEVGEGMAEELLAASDQYMLEGLKALCQQRLGGALARANLAALFDLSERYNAPQLECQCLLFALEKYEELAVPGPYDTGIEPEFLQLLHRLVPRLRASITEQLQRKASVMAD